MRYRLKNRALQAALEKATDGAFSELLQDCEGVEIEVNGVKMEIEAVPVREFDPTQWNAWPETEPPQDVPLRIEVLLPDAGYKYDFRRDPPFCGIRMRTVACFDGFDWYFWPGKGYTARVSIEKGEVVRFRPWVGPGEEAVG